ncbi:unnamed protein product [Oreochromis niloticus]|nr:unnamed protein product [Mustela putorius furo]
MGQEKVVSAHSLTGLEVSGLGSNAFYELPEILTQERVPVTTDNFVKKEDLVSWPYLSKVQISHIMANVDLLIGCNTPKLLEHGRHQQHKHRGEFTASSSMSMNGEMSREFPPVFSHEPGPSVTKRQEHKHRGQFPGSSSISTNSDASKEFPPGFNHESRLSVSKCQQHKHSGQFPGSSSMSTNSDASKEFPPGFSHESQPSVTKCQQHKHSGQFPGSSSMSTNSDASKEFPPGFNHESRPSATSFHRKKRSNNVFVEKPVSCCLLCQDVLKDSTKDFSPQCGEKSRTRANTCLQKVLNELKLTLRKRYEHVIEETEKTGSRALLRMIYTELYITEEPSEAMNYHHEVRQVQSASKKKILHETPIRSQDIFKTLPDQQRPIRVVLTYGVAGVGKTFLVQKFTLDWAEGLENQHISAVILLSFRELNLVRNQQYSLLELLIFFHPTLHRVTAEKLIVCKLLFILDGLDESRFLLDFTNSKLVSDVTQKSTISELLSNLIEGNLLPSALIWITSRPAAVHQIAPTCLDRMTEVRGFTDAQKEEYFRRRFRNKELSSRIISHLKTSRSLYIMCGIPVYCWITATVLEHMLTTEESTELPKTLTDMYSHFLLVQTKKKQKYHEGQEMR